MKTKPAFGGLLTRILVSKARSEILHPTAWFAFSTGRKHGALRPQNYREHLQPIETRALDHLICLVY